MILAGALLFSPLPGSSQIATPDEPMMPPPAAMETMPAVPAITMVAFAPPAPRTPPVPAKPALPVAGMTPASNSGSRHHDGPVSDCSELRMEFHGQRAAIESEERTFSKSEAATVHVDELDNGGVQFQGWDKDLYSVTLCKAVDPSSGDAKQLLSDIKLSVQAGHVSIHGPSHQHDWNVHLLIRTPRAANVELTAHNGPVSFYQVDGKITARGTNGPISMQDCTGEADISAVNGPISFSGNGGKLRLHTENGPISLALNSATFGGSSLVADAVNGPLTLNLPSGFQSSFLVESSGHSPMSCHASICTDARKTWDDEHRRIEFGNGSPLIRVSTQNGPISVNAL
jgi:hypothetical protein